MLPARVIDPPALAVLNPRSIDISDVSLGSTGLLQPTPESIIFLGHVYPYSVLQGISKPLPPTDELCADLARPDPERLLSLLGVGELGMRALYLHMHWLLEEQRDMRLLPPALVAALLAEYVQYRRIDLAWLRKRVYKRLDQKTDEHWRFQGHLAQHKRRPDVLWRGHVDVPVHRLLWPTINQSQPLRPEQRLRKRDICPDEFARDCVNPAHFEIAIPMTERRALAPGQQFTQASKFTNYRHKWTRDNVWFDTFMGIQGEWVHCGEGHIMPSGVQRSWKNWSDETGPWYRPDPGATSKCERCYERYRQEVGVRSDGRTLNRRPRGLQAPNERANDQAFNDWQRGAIASIVAAGGEVTTNAPEPSEEDIDAGVEAFLKSGWLSKPEQ